MGRNERQQQWTFRRTAVIGVGVLALAAAGCGGSGSLTLGATTTANTTTASATAASTTTVGSHSTAAHQSVSVPTTPLVASSTSTPTTTVPPATTVPTTTAPTTTKPSTTAAPLPTVDVNPVDADYTPAVKPSTIYLSGDATNIVTKLRWAGWDGHGATGYGTVDVLSCVPNCAQGSATPTPVTIYLNDPVHGAFSVLTEIVQGTPARNYTVPTS